MLPPLGGVPGNWMDWGSLSSNSAAETRRSVNKSVNTLLT